MASAELDWYSIRGSTIRSRIEERIAYNGDDKKLFASTLVLSDYDLGLAWFQVVDDHYWSQSDTVCDKAIALMSNPNWEKEL
jgi:hypothetical protein